jgi:hypothetical protein
MGLDIELEAQIGETALVVPIEVEAHGVVPLGIVGAMGIGGGFLTVGPRARGGGGDVDGGVEAGAVEREQRIYASARDVLQIDRLLIHGTKSITNGVKKEIGFRLLLIAKYSIAKNGGVI